MSEEKLLVVLCVAHQRVAGALDTNAFGAVSAMHKWVPRACYMGRRRVEEACFHALPVGRSTLWVDSDRSPSSAGRHRSQCGSGVNIIYVLGYMAAVDPRSLRRSRWRRPLRRTYWRSTCPPYFHSFFQSGGFV
ncbi:unnamed protein product [Ectocarpus sp. 4 AP-2014]